MKAVEKPLGWGCRCGKWRIWCAVLEPGGAIRVAVEKPFGAQGRR